MPSSSTDRIVFDLDDTLYLERDFVFSGYRTVGDWLLQTEGVAGFAGACRALFEAGERRRVFDRALAGCGFAPDRVATLVPQLVARYRGHAPDITLCADAARFLAAHAPVAVITDGPEATQRAKAAALRLERFCDLLVPTAQWGMGFEKPHPRAFEAVAAAARGRPCVYVADNAAKDFLAPKRLGWRSVQILRPDRVHEGLPPSPAHAADRVIESIDQLEAALASLAG